MVDKHVLVVDDDPVMRDVITDYLSGQDFRVSAAANGREMANILSQKSVDLMILDLKLTNEDGLELMRSLGPDVGVPVIVVTGHRRDEVDRVVGLELGADDYMTKPFGLRELLARVRAVLRRWEAGARRGRQADKSVRYRFNGWHLSVKTRRLTSPDGQTVSLTAGEFNLLLAFLRSPQHVLSREQLLAASRVHDDDVFDRSIDVQILRLRRKLEPDPSNPTLLKTERGAGYLFNAPVDVL